jgi:hypothetical protein
MRFIIFVATFLLMKDASALETDNYLVWKRDLQDSSAVINEYFQKNLEEVRRENLSCSALIKKVAHRFRSFLVHDNPVENYLFKTLDKNAIFPRTLFFVEESIYRDPYLFYIPQFGLAPNIQVNGYYFGTDKLSHFAWVGYLYYKARNLEKAIEYGIQDEKTLHGYWASGVFSYADLEANYQGYLFYSSLCDKSQAFDIRRYVNGNWDESYNLSYRIEANWKKVAPVLREEYCPMRTDPEVLARFAYYHQNSSKSASMEFLEKRSDLPRPQSFKNLCEQ